MTIYEATQEATLLADTDLAALIGTRVYPRQLPGNPTLPAVTYRLISSPRIQTQTGPSFTRPRYRWDCWATDYDTAVAVGIAVMKALAQGRWVDDESDADEPLTGLFRRRVETLGWINPPEAP